MIKVGNKHRSGEFVGWFIVVGPLTLAFGVAIGAIGFPGCLGFLHEFQTWSLRAPFNTLPFVTVRTWGSGFRVYLWRVRLATSWRREAELIEPEPRDGWSRETGRLQ